MPDEVKKEALKELGRLSRMSPMAADYSLTRNYIEWLAVLPWAKTSGQEIEIPKAKEILDTDHYDLEKVKDRILDYLSVRRLKPNMKGPILCFVGPPGVGKTSLGKSIARALGRKFVRLSLGGVHDEAEIRGHRRTYIGALPGQIIQGIRRAETKDPVFMLDEIDKVGRDFRGDPASALLEALDPEQNSTFRDNYLDVTFDLSKVLFITTANMLDPIAEPLRDRMEIIELQGYSEEEKVHIAFRYLIPRQIDENGITGEQIEFPEEAVRYVIRHYTREAGVRSLERTIGTICRKQARRLAEGKTEKLIVTKDVIQEFLGGIKIRSEGEIAERTERPGVAVGLAWTPSGGDVLFVEANAMKGKGGFTMTGQIGQVMQESMQAALTWVRSNADRLGVAEDFFANHDIAYPRSGRGDSEGWTFGGCDHGDGVGFVVDQAPHHSAAGDDRRDHAERQCPSGRRDQREGAGGQARRSARCDSARGKQDERGRGSHAGATGELDGSLCEDHRRGFEGLVPQVAEGPAAKILSTPPKDPTQDYNPTQPVKEPEPVHDKVLTQA